MGRCGRGRREGARSRTTRVRKKRMIIKWGGKEVEMGGFLQQRTDKKKAYRSAPAAKRNPVDPIYKRYVGFAREGATIYHSLPPKTKWFAQTNLLRATAAIRPIPSRRPRSRRPIPGPCSPNPLRTGPHLRNFNKKRNARNVFGARLSREGFLFLGNLWQRLFR